MCKGSGPYSILESAEFVNRVLEGKSQSIKDNNFLNNLYKKIENDTNKSDRKTLKFVQFTDAHLDLDYKEGTLTSCKEPICCREKTGYPDPETIE